ncbi:MAG: FG-GAP repeat protein, partial [Candidatus Yanofskybacteria bacterium]|nr:FG-GAP repeat protein [Candidatus Yanofskybacteria bacterium]
MLYYSRMRQATSWLAALVVVVSVFVSFAPAVQAAYSQEQKIAIPSSAAFDFADHSAVTPDGSRMIIGARGKEAAYIYVRSGTTWTLEQQITGSDTVAGDNFGNSVAITSDGSRVVVGSYRQALNDPGAVYVFSRSGATWTEEQKLTASDIGAGINGYFGYSVGIADDGSRLIVGARGGRNGALAATGSAYIFTRSGVTWTEEQELNASDGVVSDYFGGAVAIDSTGTRVAIGASRRNTYTGAVYVFSRSGVTWTEEQIVTASDGTNYDEFGYEFSVSLDDAGTRMAVGAYGYTGGNYTGAVYVFSRSGVTWTEEQKLLASDTATGSLFGVSTALTGDGATLSVGAYGVGSYQGAGYVFARVATTWSESEKITAADGAASDQFGITTAIVDDGSRVFFGSDVNSSAGAIYVFTAAAAAPATVSGGSSSLCTGELRVTLAPGSSVDSLHLDSGVIQSGTLYPVACGTHTVSAVPSTQGMSV